MAKNVAVTVMRLKPARHSERNTASSVLANRLRAAR
jgi:hypothetical protein